MVFSLYPQLYIDAAVPEGWAREYPTVQVSNVESARNVLEKYYEVEGDFILGVDFRGASYFVLTLFLKFLETTSLKVILRAIEPIPPTIVSRMARVIKKPIEDRQSVLKLLLGDRIISQKVLELK